jgi:hypothetical protein
LTPRATSTVMALADRPDCGGHRSPVPNNPWLTGTGTGADTQARSCSSATR